MFDKTNNLPNRIETARLKLEEVRALYSVLENPSQNRVDLLERVLETIVPLIDEVSYFYEQRDRLKLDEDNVRDLRRYQADLSAVIDKFKTIHSVFDEIDSPLKLMSETLDIPPEEYERLTKSDTDEKTILDSIEVKLVELENKFKAQKEIVEAYYSDVATQCGSLLENESIYNLIGCLLDKLQDTVSETLSKASNVVNASQDQFDATKKTMALEVSKITSVRKQIADDTKAWQGFIKKQEDTLSQPSDTLTLNTDLIDNIDDSKEKFQAVYKAYYRADQTLIGIHEILSDPNMAELAQIEHILEENRQLLDVIGDRLASPYHQLDRDERFDYYLRCMASLSPFLVEQNNTMKESISNLSSDVDSLISMAENIMDDLRPTLTESHNARLKIQLKSEYPHSDPNLNNKNTF